MRSGDLIDEFVEKVCLTRLARPDARRLFETKSDGPSLSVLFGLRKDLVRREKELAMAMAEGMDWPAAKPAMEKIKAERTQTEQRIAEAVRESPLPPTIGDDSVRKWWEETVLEKRRMVVETLVKVKILPIGKGRRVTSLEQVGGTVLIDWKSDV